MSTGLSPKMKNLDLNMDLINEKFLDQLFDILQGMLPTIPDSDRNDWRNISKDFSRTKA
jgi:hypothetical protein